MDFQFDFGFDWLLNGKQKGGNHEEEKNGEVSIRGKLEIDGNPGQNESRIETKGMNDEKSGVQFPSGAGCHFRWKE